MQQIVSTATKPKVATIIGVVAGISILGGLAMGIFSLGGTNYRKIPQSSPLNTNSLTACTTPRISNITADGAVATDTSTTTFRRGDFINVHGCGFGRFYETEAVAFTGSDRIARPSCQITTPTGTGSAWTDTKITCRIRPETTAGNNLETRVWLGGTVSSNSFVVNITE